MNPHGLIPASRIFGAIFLLPVIAAVVIGVYFYRSTRGFLATAVHCQGQVTEMISESGDNGTMYAPVFVYKDAAGTIHTGHSSTYTRPASYAVGDGISILCDPKNPGDYRIESFWSLWLGPLIAGVFAVPMLIVSAIFLFLVPFTIRRVWPNVVPVSRPLR